MTPSNLTGRLAFAATCLILLGQAPPARADLIIMAQNATAYAGSTGDALYVTLLNVGPTIDIGGFSFELTASSSDITFTDVAVGAPSGFTYIFAGHSLFGPDITNNVSGQTISAADNYDTQNQGTLLLSGQTYGLGIVHYNVAATAPPETIQVSFTNFPATSLSDQNNNNLNDATGGGTITITPLAVPEPAGLTLVVIGLATLGGWRSFREFKAAQRLLDPRRPVMG